MAQDITLDTVIGLAGTDTLDIRTAIEFRIRVSNSSGDTYYGATNGFRLYSPDGATWVPHIYYDTTIVQFPSVDTIVDTTYFGRWADNIYIDSIWDGGYFVNFYSDHDDSALTPDLFGQGSDTIGFGGYQQEGWGLYDSFDEIMYTIRLDSIPASSGGKTICLDSAFYRPTGYWRWADPDTIPSWDGPHCYFIKYLIPPGPGESVVGGGGEEESLYKPGEVEFATEVETAYRHFERYRGRFRMKDPRNELRLERADRDKWGMIHVRFNQFHGNARVIGRDVIVHLHPVGTIDRITNGYVPDINVSPAYSVSVGSAVGAVLLDRAALSESEYNVEKSELIVDTWGDSVRLAWQIAVTADDRSDRWTYLVDAHSGDKIRELKSALAFDPEQCGIGEGWGLTGYHHHIDVTYDSLYFSGSYHWYLFDHSRRDVNSNPGCMHGHDGNMDSNAEIASIDNGLGYEYSDSWQIDSLGDTIITFDSTTEFRRAAVDAQVYTGHIYDWLLERFGWNSWNNQGSSMNIVGMHRTTQHDHCIWADSRVTCYTPTDTIYRRPLSACPEIVAHEWIHAVEDATDHLFDFSTVQGKALGEAVPAILGNAFLQWYDPNNSDPWRAGQNGFKYGDSCWTDFADTHSDLIPSENGPQADYWGPEGSPVDTLWCLDTIPVCNWRLRGIAQKWFYLLSEGGSHYGVSVNPLNGGVDEAADLVFYSLLYEFSAEEDYQTFAMKTLSTSLYMDICTGAGCPGRDTLGPKDTTRARLVQEAWAAVGVLDPYQDSDGDNWSDLVDNCPDTANPDQQDTDKDGIGDICESSCCALRGDMDHDGSVNIADLTYLIAFSFKSGPEAHCVEEGDVNGDDSQDVSDVTFLVSYMFKNGGVPPACSI